MTYFMGFIGAAVYLIQHSKGFWPAVIAILKAIVWPLILTYKAFGMMGM